MSALADRQGSPAVDPSSSRGDGPYVAARPCVAHALRACKGPCAAQTGGHSRPHLCCLEPPYTYLCCCSKPCAVLLHGWRCKWQRLRQTAGCVTATRPDATLEPLENCPSDSPCSTSFVDIVRAPPPEQWKAFSVCLFVLYSLYVPVSPLSEPRRRARVEVCVRARYILCGVDTLADVNTCIMQRYRAQHEYSEYVIAF